MTKQCKVKATKHFNNKVFFYAGRMDANRLQSVKRAFKKLWYKDDSGIFHRINVRSYCHSSGPCENKCTIYSSVKPEILQQLIQASKTRIG